jgi:histidinol-phosphate phosphatase family protein
MHLKEIDKSWTLFLDRDGVINAELKNDYVLEWESFHFLEGVKQALKTLNGLFTTIVIVTNQKCIGKGLISEAGLAALHQQMIQEIEESGGRIDKIYYCPDLSDDSPNRKPNAGMALQAKADFPLIDFSKSIMVGNKLSDMQFGRNAGVHTVFAATTNPETAFPHPAIDYRVNSLLEFSEALINAL